MRILLILLIGSINFAFAQVPKNSELFLALQKHDSIFFERCFNQCDFTYMEKMIHKDLAFYHDRGGIQDKKKFLENTKKNLCSDSNKKPIRKVRKESLEVFPLYDDGVLYGVVQNGTHDFYIREPNKVDKQTGSAKFTHVYLLENKEWILKEVLSFDDQ